VRITDNRDNHISMSHTSWATITEHRSDIEQLVQSIPEAIPRKIHNLIIEMVKIRNENVVKFISHDISIYIHETFNCAFYARS